MTIRQYVFQDWQANLSNPTKGKYIVVLFRIAQLIIKRRFTKVLFCWYLLFYRLIIEWFMCVELSWKTTVGSGFQIWHGSGLVIHPETIIGKNCSIRQCTTIGVKLDYSGMNNIKAPIIGDSVDIGCNTVIIGDISIGNHVAIGAGSVVVKPIPDYAVVAGNPSKIIRINQSLALSESQDRSLLNLIV